MYCQHAVAVPPGSRNFNANSSISITTTSAAQLGMGMEIGIGANDSSVATIDKLAIAK